MQAFDASHSLSARQQRSSSPADVLLISGLLEHEQPAHLQEDRHLLLQLLIFCLQGVLSTLNLQTGTAYRLSTGPTCTNGQEHCEIQVWHTAGAQAQAGVGCAQASMVLKVTLQVQS